MVFRRLIKSAHIPVATIIVTAGTFYGSEISAVTQYTKERKPFIFDPTPLHSLLVLPVTDSIEKVKLTEFQLRERALKAPKDDTVEPLTLTLPTSDGPQASLIEKIAAPEKINEFKAYVEQALRNEKKVDDKSPKTVVIDEKGLELISPDAFAELFSRNHHSLIASGQELKNAPEVRRELLREIAPFLSRSERDDLKDKIKNGDPIEIDRFLLPEFARRMVGKFISFRGPNCFHAALAFQSPKFTSSTWVNIKEEKGYHRAMINYDELWRILSRNFYEVPATEAPLRYGDVLVFFDVPKAAEKDPTIPVDFHWIRHTATYLFNGYTFSKGSKSPNTPYLVRTLNEEWSTWKGYTKNLGLKIFRRSSKKVKVKPAFDATDWVY